MSKLVKTQIRWNRHRKLREVLDSNGIKYRLTVRGHRDNNCINIHFENPTDALWFKLQDIENQFPFAPFPNITIEKVKVSAKPHLRRLKGDWTIALGETESAYNEDALEELTKLLAKEIRNDI